MALNPAPAQAAMTSPEALTPAADILSRVLHRDAMMLIIDKPAGMAVHAGPENAEARNARAGGEVQHSPLSAHLPSLRFGLPRPPELAHRLDRDTSGCLILGRHRQALARLAELFKAGAVAKTYWAVVEGAPAADEGRIDLALGRLDPKRGWWMKADPAGQPSSTLWRVLGRSPDGRLAFVALTPLTGRTHQLRVHMQASGWPILGDAIYGSAPRFGGPGLHLHARAVVVPLYAGKPPVFVTASAPPRMREALEACGWREEQDGAAQPAS